MPFEWNNMVVVTADELVPAFYNTLAGLQQEVYRYKNQDYGIKQVQRGGNGRRALYLFDSLEKEMQTALGDPRKIHNAMERYYKTDREAVNYYTKAFKFDDDTPLSLKHQDEYITNASVLRAAIALKAKREYELRTKNGSFKGIMATVCRDVTLFNEVLKVKHNATHTLPASEKRFKEVFRAFENGFNYDVLISGKLKNENRKLVTDELLELLNDMFAAQTNKPTRTEIARQYEAFLGGYVEVIDRATGEAYDPAAYKPIGESTIINYLNKWADKIGTHKHRSGNRQQYMNDYKTYHKLIKPAFAGSILSVDDRQPPFRYDAKNRVWFYMGIDLGSEAWTCWVSGSSKEGIIEAFYRQLLRNYHEWGVNMPDALECEISLNNSYANSFLQEGRMFQNVRMEANNARGKRIERFFGTLRYGSEKLREGWIARPHARNESNRAGRRNAQIPSKDDDLTKAPIIPYNTIVQNSLTDIMNWNNAPHSVHADKSRWEVFMENQHPGLKPINWEALLPLIGYKTQTSCQLDGIIHLNNEEYLLGMDGEVALGDKLINLMSKLAGKQIDVYWIDGNDKEIIKAVIYERNKDVQIGEAVKMPAYNRAPIERTEKDEAARRIMSAYDATILAYGKRKYAAINTDILVIDNRPTTLNRKFVIPGLEGYNPEELETTQDAEVLPRDDDAAYTPVEALPFKKTLLERF